MSMRDYLIEQTIITANILRQSKVHPHLSTWCQHNRVFDYNTTLMGPAVCRVLINEPVKNRILWRAHTIKGHYTGPALYYHRNVTVFLSKTRSSRVSDTVEFRHAIITVPQITPEDKVINAITKLKSELAFIPAHSKHNQIEAIANLRNLFSKHSKNWEAPNNNTDDIPPEYEEIINNSPRVPIIEESRSPRVPELDIVPQ